MGIISWIVMGLLVGIIAKVIMPGKDPGGAFMTMIIGIAGAFIGGFISKILGFGSFRGFDLYSILIAIGGAILLLVGYRIIKK